MRGRERWMRLRKRVDGRNSRESRQVDARHLGDMHRRYQEDIRQSRLVADAEGSTLGGNDALDRGKSLVDPALRPRPQYLGALMKIGDDGFGDTHAVQW